MKPLKTPSQKKFPMPAAELRALVRRVTISCPDGREGVIDTLAHVNREIQLGAAFDRPVHRFIFEGVQFCKRGVGNEETITVKEVPAGEPHKAYSVSVMNGHKVII